MIFKIKLISSDNNILEYRTECSTKEEAKTNAMERIEELGWDRYEYKINRIIPIKNFKRGK